jgi:2-polyprenyl-3-methyl-5-hydroxy-6-metoxy-1,4-benzoquinol methylase
VAPAVTSTSAAAPAGHSRSRALGWRIAGIEMDEAAAALARRYTEELHVGDILTAPFPSARFDVVTAFHVLEHVPDPVAVARRMLAWLAPAGS